MTDSELIRKLWDYGHFNNPAFPDLLNVEEAKLPLLKTTDAVVRQAVSSWQNYNGAQMDVLSNAYHMRPSIADGQVGPATRDSVRAERCGFPDYGYLDDNGNIVRGELPAVGTGNWKECHGVKGFHAVSLHVDESGLPSFLKPHWDEVKRRVAVAYAELGLRIFWDDQSKRANSNISFVSRSSGWIGLATVGRGRTCSGSPIFARFLSTYKGGSSAESIITQWTTLVKHELGHNCGLSHSRGGVMNPSIVNNLPVSWKGDPSYGLLRQWFGGVAVDLGGTPVPPPGTPPAVPVPGIRPTVEGTVEIIVPEGCRPGAYQWMLVQKPQL